VVPPSGDLECVRTRTIALHGPERWLRSSRYQAQTVGLGWNPTSGSHVVSAPRRPRCITDVSIRGAPCCVGLFGQCRSIRVSPRLDHCVPTFSGTNQRTQIFPNSGFGSRRPRVRISPSRLRSVSSRRCGSVRGAADLSPMYRTSAQFLATLADGGPRGLALVGRLDEVGFVTPSATQSAPTFGLFKR